jgi:hypothetical protein
MPSLAQATDGANADDRARHGLKLTGQACHWPSARRRRPEPSAAFVQIAFLAYLGCGQRLRARRFHRRYTAAALIPRDKTHIADRAKSLEPDERVQPFDWQALL